MGALFLSGLIAASYEEARLVNNKEVVLAEIEIAAEQQRLTEQEEAEIQRQQHLMNAQLQFAATLQADLDALRVILRSGAPLPRPEGPTNGDGHGKAYQLLPETVVC